MAAKGIAEAGHVWIVGNPWWDIAIHATFSLAYAALLVPRKQVAVPSSTGGIGRAMHVREADREVLNGPRSAASDPELAD